MQKSLSFIFPKLQLGLTEWLNKGLVTTYMGSTEYEVENGKEWGDVYILEFKSLSQEDIDILSKNKYYKDWYSASTGETHVVFEFDEESKFKIIRPFLNGAYGEIDRDYVETHFYPKIYNEEGKLIAAPNYRILTKDPTLLDYWETLSHLTDPTDKKYWQRTSLNIPEGAEVWPKPEKSDEIYGYKQDVISNLQ